MSTEVEPHGNNVDRCHHANSLAFAMQHAYRSATQASDLTKREQHLAVFTTLCEQLFEASRDALFHEARRWLHSQIGKEQLAYHPTNDAILSIARSTYGALLERLLKVEIDPHGNVIGLIRQMARRNLYTQERHIYLDIPRRSKPPPVITQMYPPRSSSLEGVWLQTEEGYQLQEAVDADQIPVEEVAIQHVDDAVLVEQVHELWTSLSMTDQRILWMRFIANPPLEHHAIARALGAGWTASHVRVHLHRLLKRLRKQLNKLDTSDE